MFNERNFCIGPWSEIRILPDGKLNWCHCARYDDNTDFIQDTDLDSYFNGNSVKIVRNQLLAGQDVLACKNCYSDETKVIYSHRRRRNIQMAIFPLEHFEKSLLESPMPARIKDNNIKPYFYNIVLGNVCNLSCIMCDPYYSTRVATDLKRINWGKPFQSGLLDWTQDDTSWQKFINHIDSNENIVCMHFQGGEPMLHVRFKEFLKHCVEIKHTNFHLTMVTNGTVFDQELIGLFKHFKSCQIEISVETMTKVNSYIRYPVNSNQFAQNLKNFLTVRDNQLDIILRTVPQLLSVLDYVSLLDFCLEHAVCVDSNIIANPGYLKPAVWPKHIRDTVASRLEKFKEKLNMPDAPVELNLRSQVHVNLKQNADLVLNSLDEIITNRKELQYQAQDYFSRLDQLRRLNITDYCPEFAEING